VTPSEIAAALREMAERLLATANTIDPVNIDVDVSGSPGAALIARERIRQITEEGFSASGDRSHTGNELAWGAYAYLERASQDRLPQDDPSTPHVWPWKKGQWRPKGSRIRNLTIAAALIAAEIDRRWQNGERP